MTKIERAYARLGKLVFSTAFKFAAKYRLNDTEKEEAIANANWLFVNAVRKYDKTRAKLEGWIVYKLTQELTGILRKELRRGSLLKRVERDFEEMSAEEYRSFDLIDFFDSLDEDGQIVINLVFDTPKDVIRHARKLGDVSDPYNLRAAIRRRLRRDGWSRRRVERTFQLISEKL